MHPSVLFLASGLLIDGASPGSATAQTMSPTVANAVTSYAAFIDEAAQRFELPASWIRAVLRAESGGDPRAVSPAGAMGLMQIMPATWDELRVHHGLGADPFDPRDNILAGAAYLRQLHDRYGSIRAMLAAYNAGPARYEASLAGERLPLETRTYIAALAPIIDKESAAGATELVRPMAQSWREAPLFAAPAARSNQADTALLTPRSGALFVAPLPSRRAP
ncbi:MAG TPA: lytic transglycosylase domain-containing protein [Xanthobacteraceae bacterium]|jgi:membrane-bound lytic murein transglycosylase B|nr:MAG: transglycosylase [Rhizobiales bacterium 35-66-30]OZA97387.1 MAG: transglycosylase [Rhizobiales bacterium 39-66-18]HQS11066.1 lytic transglycosylase domain-containing protein [Xanthobacteraceae bacterium]HQS50079.1 lytic transglycosylase domain-containing protein [Xanthobacteraceae bacterium]